MKQDRFLIGILITIGVLVVISLVMFFIRQDIQTYGPEDTPEGLLRNYVLAVQAKEADRIQTYLVDKKNKPTLERIQQALFNRELDAAQAGVQIGEVIIKGEKASVEVILIYGGTDPFSGTWRNYDTARLVQQNGDWRIEYMPYPYWVWDWYEEEFQP